MDNFQSRSTREGRSWQAMAETLIKACGFHIVETNHRIPDIGVMMNVVAKDDVGESWYFDVSGATSTARPGLVRTDTLWKTLGRLCVCHAKGIRPCVALTTNLPKPDSTGHKALKAVGPGCVFDAIEITSLLGKARLRVYSKGNVERAVPGFWTTELWVRRCRYQLRSSPLTSLKLTFLPTSRPTPTTRKCSCPAKPAAEIRSGKPLDRPSVRRSRRF